MTTNTKLTLEDIENALDEAEGAIDDAIEAIPDEGHDAYDLENAVSAIEAAVRFLNDFEPDNAERELVDAKDSIGKLRGLVTEFVSGGATAGTKPDFMWNLGVPGEPAPNPLVASACYILVEACQLLADTLDNVNESTTDDGRVGGLLDVSRVMVMLQSIEGCIAARQLTSG